MTLRSISRLAETYWTWTALSPHFFAKICLCLCLCVSISLSLFPPRFRTWPYKNISIVRPESAGAECKNPGWRRRRRSRSHFWWQHMEGHLESHRRQNQWVRLDGWWDGFRGSRPNARIQGKLHLVGTIVRLLYRIIPLPSFESILNTCSLPHVIYVSMKEGSLLCFVVSYEIHQTGMPHIMFLVSLESSRQGGVHGLWFHDVWICINI